MIHSEGNHVWSPQSEGPFACCTTYFNSQNIVKKTGRNPRVEKPVINYPCKWNYRIVGADGDLIKKGIAEKLQGIEHTISDGNTSSRGNYVSINVDALVHTEEERLSITSLLRKIPAVKIVL